jgi:hypothetical protein
MVDLAMKLCRQMPHTSLVLSLQTLLKTNRFIASAVFVWSMLPGSTNLPKYCRMLVCTSFSVVRVAGITSLVGVILCISHWVDRRLHNLWIMNIYFSSMSRILTAHV